jgi:hypothetical protein
MRPAVPEYWGWTPTLARGGDFYPAIIGYFYLAIDTAMAVSHWIEHQTGWSIKKFVRTARRFRTVVIQT